MGWKHATIALAVVLMAISADVSFGRGGGGGGGRGAGGSGGNGPARIQGGNVQGGGGQTGGQGGNQAGGPSRIQGGNVQPNNQAGNQGGNVAGAGTQSHTAYYRGNANLARNNSTFFGKTGLFNQNTAIGRQPINTKPFGNYGGYASQGHGPVINGAAGHGLGPGGLVGVNGYGGYGGYGLGYGYGGGGFLPFLGGLGLGYGLGAMGGFGGYGGGGGYGGYGGGGYATTTTGNGQAVAAGATQPTQAAADTAANPPTSMGTDYVTLGETDFRAGKYDLAIGAFRHALVDEPNNAGLMMMTAQALFQTGKWTQAAAATELAMAALPEDQWGVVVQNYKQLYGNASDFTNQLKSLEAAVKATPDDPALRFLLGFQYGYLNYPKQAADELGKAVELEGRDPAARKLHDIFAVKANAPLVGPVPQPAGGAKPDQPQADPPLPKTSGVIRPVLRIAG